MIDINEIVTYSTVLIVEIHVSSLGVSHCSQLQSTPPGSDLYFEV